MASWGRTAGDRYSAGRRCRPLLADDRTWRQWFADIRADSSLRRMPRMP
ncbi:hypothetical protein TVNIR_1292 [Thioalkalivibrio nitratireducens DSM 14787]|uniref:Uncharacterized protein n=1 Tax=Thioalkalivibrio nitratireducens (strain DSM 14787 / UNIQEM 213 / ALEN2) TaxID=1255043 RepID=L0DVG1_THIND|nr:hypothetical protein TVNIR_1292 [Thioalkalivibrio nitratireducens DSM 14787]